MKRVRLSPHDRRMQLLDCAGKILLDNGLSQFTIDALAKEAQVSTPLVYKYFDTRLVLLQALLVRESERVSGELRERVDHASRYEELVRVFVELNFDGARRGSLLNLLYSQPDVRRGLDPAEFSWVSEVLVERTRQEFQLATAEARQVLFMGSAASRTAAERFNRHRGDRTKSIELTVRFIMGAFRAASSGASG